MKILLDCLNKLSKIVTMPLRTVSGFSVLESLGNMFWGLFSAFVVMRLMFTIKHYYKVVGTVIISFTIYMMNNLSFNEIATNLFLHYQSMFANITSFCSKWMFRSVYICISIPFYLSASPFRIIFSKFKITFFRTICCCTIFKIATVNLKKIATSLASKLYFVSYPFIIYPHNYIIDCGGNDVNT